ncbi:DUF5667 domain-containing protein [Chloroflexota bacterium]
MMKAKEFDNILNECLERMLVKGETMEQCLASYPEQAAELEPLLQTAQVARKAAAVKPRPEFREKARYQFRSAFQEMEAKRGFGFFGWQPQWATAVIVALVLLLVGSSTVAAAGNSMPDEPLYQVKLATETVRLVLTPSAMGKAELYVRLADKRIEEIIKMADEGKPEQVERAAQRLSTQLIAMASLVASPEQEAFVVTVPAPQEALAPAVDDKSQEKEAALFMAPAPKVTLPEEQALPKGARGAPSSPGPGRGGNGGGGKGSGGNKEAGGKGVEDDKKTELKEAVTRLGAEHTAVLREVLERAPESVKPALQRAIEKSEKGYKKALEAFD